jgi:SAM-dependent methyltransferase
MSGSSLRIIWPEPERRRRLVERIALRTGRTVGYCVLCGRVTTFVIRTENFRDDVYCRVCGSTNRQRQIALVLLDVFKERGARRALGLKSLPEGLRLWNLEARGPLHDSFRAASALDYTASEYLSPDLASGTTREGVQHIDVQRTHFPAAHLDVVVSSDVLEHVPRPLDALHEIRRVLRLGGVHVFTVPFFAHRFKNEQRAVEDQDRTIRHLLPALHHDDPLRPEGALVYQIFGIELLCELERMQFPSVLMRVYSPALGILGANGFVIVSRRRPTAQDAPRVPATGPAAH